MLCWQGNIWVHFWFCLKFSTETHLCSRRGKNLPERTISSSTVASQSCPKSTKQHTLWWLNTHSRSQTQYFKQTAHSTFSWCSSFTSRSIFYQVFLCKSITRVCMTLCVYVHYSGFLILLYVLILSPVCRAILLQQQERWDSSLWNGPVCQSYGPFHWTWNPVTHKHAEIEQEKLRAHSSSISSHHLPEVHSWSETPSDGIHRAQRLKPSCCL